jgi:putative endonuclease
MENNISQVWFVYIVQCNDDKNTLYTGITNNLEKRLKAHNSGKGAKYTKGRRPVSLIRFFICSDKSEALKLEIYIKSLSRQEKFNFSLDDYKQ